MNNYFLPHELQPGIALCIRPIIGEFNGEVALIGNGAILDWFARKLAICD
jgi:hypothetical protein